MNCLNKCGEFVCMMMLPLALAFVACSNGDDKSVAGGSAEETGVYALAGRVGDVVPRTLEASRRSAEVQKVVELSETQNSSRDSSVAKQAYMGTLFATKGTVVSIYELDSLTLEKTGRYYADTIDNDSGKFSFENIELASPYVLIETLDSCETASCAERGAWYMRPYFTVEIVMLYFKLDDGSEDKAEPRKDPKERSKFPLQRSAIVDLRKSKNVSVNSLSDAKVPLLLKHVAEGLSFEEANVKSEQEILELLGVYENLENFESVDDEDSELAFVRELALIVSASVNDVRFDLEYGDIDLFFMPPELYAGEQEKEYRNAMKMIGYKVGYLARLRGLERCTESLENKMFVVEGKLDSITLVCRSEKWTLGFKSIEYTKGSLKDKRDGKKYKTVTYNFGETSQTWMSENLCFGEDDCGVFGKRYEWIAAMDVELDDIKVFLEKKLPGSTEDTVFLEKKCLDEELEKMRNCADDYSHSCMQSAGESRVSSECLNGMAYQSYGGTWNYAEFVPQTKVDSYQGICPDGWRIPTSSDWKTLLQNMGELYGVDADNAGVFLYDETATGFGLKPSDRSDDGWDAPFVVADVPNYFAKFSINFPRESLPLEKIELYVYTGMAFTEPMFYKTAFVRCIKK